MKKYRVIDYIPYTWGDGVKYLFPDDVLILIKESEGHGSARGNCTPASKTFAHSKTREQIILASCGIDKIELVTPFEEDKFII